MKLLFEYLTVAQRTSRPKLSVLLNRGDLVLAMALGLLGVLVSVVCMSMISTEMYRYGGDVWYDADPVRVLGTMVYRQSEYQLRASVHPLFALFTLPPTKLLTAAGLHKIEAALIVVGAMSFLTVALMCLAVRALGLPRAATALFMLILMTSSAYLSFFSFIETYIFSSLTVALMLFVTAAVRQERYGVWLAAAAGTLSGTVTNWVLGLTALVLHQRPLRAFLIGVGSLVAVFIIALLQRAIFPQAQLFIDPAQILWEVETFSTASGERIESYWTGFSAIWSIWVGSIFANPPVLEHVANLTILNNQRVGLGPAAIAHAIAVCSWIGLLLLAFTAGFRDPSRRAIFLTLLGFLASQTVLHLLYGRMTFLYAAHHMPALILLAAFSWFSPRRRLVLCLACLVLIFGAWANVSQFRDAAAKASAIVDHAASRG